MGYMKFRGIGADSKKRELGEVLNDKVLWVRRALRNRLASMRYVGFCGISGFLGVCGFP